MRKLLTMVLALLLVVGVSGLLGQEVPKPYTCTFNHGVGDFIFTGVTFDQVWSAMVTAFMTQDMEHRGSWKHAPVKPDRPSGSMTGIWLVGHGLTLGEWHFEILVQQRADGIEVFCSTSFMAFDKKKAQIETLFLDKVVEQLYVKKES